MFRISALVASVLVSAALLSGCSTAAGTAAPAAENQAESKSELTSMSLIAELAASSCALQESGEWSLNRELEGWAPIAEAYEESGLLDSTIIDFASPTGVVQGPVSALVLTEEQRAEVAASEEILVTVAENGQEKYDAETDSSCAVLGNGGTFSDEYLAEKGITR